MSNDHHRASLIAEATALRHLASRLAEHGVGDRWEGAARVSCEMALELLQDDLLHASRKLDHLAYYAGSHSVMARVG